MTAKKLLEKIAGRMTGIVAEDMTICERQIAALLRENGYLKLSGGTLVDKTHPEFMPDHVCPECGTEITEEFKGRCPALGILH